VRLHSFLPIALCSALALPLAAQTPATTTAAPVAKSAQSAQSAPAAAPAANTPADSADFKPIPPETKSVTQHAGTFNGRSVHYTATAGNLLIRDESDHPTASIFYVAYTEDGADAATRPVTFFYNGGPGSSSIWLHMGSFGPVRVVTDSPKPTAGPPYQLVANDQSLLDQSDLVFIDAPATGFSRIVGKATLKDFASTDADIHAFDRFIVRFLTEFHRWNSPKYLFGESYGTTRSAGLVSSLAASGVQCNGVILLSSILNYGVRQPGYDTPYISYLPTYAAIAWYHKKVKRTGTMEDFVQQARAFARGPYAAALAQGNHLPPAEFDQTAARVAEFTGLSTRYVKESNLRINPWRFRKELLRDSDRTVGRYDARFLGLDADDAGESPEYDASETGVNGAFVSAFHDYLERELKLTTGDQYFVSGHGIIEVWEFKHVFQEEHYASADTGLDLAFAMRKNPRLRVFSSNGYFDLATPFFATEYDLAHLELPAELLPNITYGYYPSGHMVYLNTDALKQLRKDLGTFYSVGSK